MLVDWQVRFPPPEVTKVLGGKYKFVVFMSEGSSRKLYPSFMVRKVEAAYTSAGFLQLILLYLPPLGILIACLHMIVPYHAMGLHIFSACP